MLGSRFPKTPAKSLCNFLVSFTQAFLCSDGCRDLAAGIAFLSVFSFFVLWHCLFPCPLAMGRRVFCPLLVLHCWHKKPRGLITVRWGHLSISQQPTPGLTLHCAVLQATATVHKCKEHSRLLGSMPDPACTESSRERPGDWLLAVGPSARDS